jgi:ADP-heptose:LPS heptosyltransferase
MFTAGIRDFKLLFPDIKVDVDSNQSALWQNNPYIEHTYKDYKDLYKEYKNEAGQDAKRRNEWLLDQGIEYYKVGYPMVGNANNTAMHFSVMFLFDMIAVADLHNELPISLGEFCAAFANGRVADPPLGEPNDEKHGRLAKEPFISLRSKYRQICKEFVRQRGDLHLTPEEKRTNIIQEVYGVEKYWVIAPGGKRDCTAKIWDWRNFQQVIDYFDGLIKFVVIGRSDHLIESLRNVIDLTDKFNKDVRGLIPLVYNADGCVSGPSFLMHLAAAMPW